jgi:hypothetical protein
MRVNARAGVAITNVMGVNMAGIDDAEILLVDAT